jgi:hypothetical protein
VAGFHSVAYVHEEAAAAGVRVTAQAELTATAKLAKQVS